MVYPHAEGRYVIALGFWWLSRYKGRLRPSTQIIAETHCVSMFHTFQCVCICSKILGVRELAKGPQMNVGVEFEGRGLDGIKGCSPFAPIIDA